MKLSLDFVPNAIMPYPLLVPVANKAQYLHIQESIKTLEIGLHWVIKIDWDSQYKIPFNKKVVNLLEPFGIYLHAIYDLCIAVHGRENVLSKVIPFRNGADWFIKICQESVDKRINTILLNSSEEFLNTDKYNRSKKRPIIETLNSEVSDLKKYNNPYKSYCYLKSLALLIDSTIELAEQSPNFNKDKYKPFVAKCRDLANCYKDPAWQRLYIEDAQLYLNGDPTKRNRAKRQNLSTDLKNSFVEIPVILEKIG